MQGSSIPNGKPVRIYVSAAPRAAASNAVSVAIYDRNTGASITLSSTQRLVIMWLDNYGPTGGLRFNLLDGSGTTLPTNLLGAFSTLQIGMSYYPIFCKVGSLPKVYYPDATDNTGTMVTFGYGEIINS